jgi:hypothetical protein
MSSVVNRLFHKQGSDPAPGDLDRAFVSEHTQFIGRFLAEHPDVRDDQRIGWRIYWDKQVDLAALKQAETDTEPDDGYGFHGVPWSRNKHS